VSHSISDGPRGARFCVETLQRLRPPRMSFATSSGPRVVSRIARPRVAQGAAARETASLPRDEPRRTKPELPTESPPVGSIRGYGAPAPRGHGKAHLLAAAGPATERHAAKCRSRVRGQNKRTVHRSASERADPIKVRKPSRRETTEAMGKLDDAAAQQLFEAWQSTGPKTFRRRDWATTSSSFHEET